MTLLMLTRKFITTSPYCFPHFLSSSYVDEVELCIRPLWVELKACAESAFDRDLEDLRQAARAALDYVCHDGGRRIVGM